MLLLLLLFLPITLLNASSPLPCRTDSDCSPFHPSAPSPGGWACIQSSCKFIVAAGELCTAPTDCASYYTPGLNTTTIKDADVCAETFCDLQSTCDSAWTHPFAPKGNQVAASTKKCCAGRPVLATCNVLGVSLVDTCTPGAHCTRQPHAVFSDPRAGIGMQCMDDASERNNIWIGIVMVLFGATTLNIGLNMQKLGYRRWEKRKAEEVEEEIEEHVKVMHRMLGEHPRGEDVVVEEDSPADAPHPFRIWLESQKPKVYFWRNGPFLNIIWLSGFILFLLGNIVNFVALRFAPQSLVAPLGAVSLVTNVVIAPWINKEKIGRWDVVGIFLICAGSAIAIVFSGHVAPEYKLCVLLNLLQKTETVVYLCIIAAGVLALWVFIRVMEARMTVRQFQQQREERRPESGSSEVETRRLAPTSTLPKQEKLEQPRGRFSRVLNPWRWDEKASHRDSAATLTHDTSILSTATSATATPTTLTPAVLRPVDEITTKPVPNHDCAPLEDITEEEGVSPSSSHVQLSSYSIVEDSVVSRYLLPLSYASLGGLMGTLTTLFAKSLINLLSASVSGENQFTHVLSWVILLVTVITAISQVFWINMGLRRYDALLQVPVFYCVWTVMDIIGGAIYYDEFKFFDATKYVLFVVGVLVIFAGVGLLAKRLKRVEDRNREEETRRVAATVVVPSQR